MEGEGFPGERGNERRLALRGGQSSNVIRDALKSKESIES